MKTIQEARLAARVVFWPLSYRSKTFIARHSYKYENHSKGWGNKMTLCCKFILLLVFLVTMLSFNQYKNHQSGQISHSGPLSLDGGMFLTRERGPPEAHLRVAHITILFDPPRLQPAIRQTLQALVLSQAAADEAFPRSWQREERFVTMTPRLSKLHFLKIKPSVTSDQCVHSLPLYTRSVMSSSVEGMI